LYHPCAHPPPRVSFPTRRSSDLPSLFPTIATRLGEEGLNRGSRIVMEKPFGFDLASAMELNRELHEVFDENQIYRIDHYLGKETDRKSTRLNSSHQIISYAVFCL